MFLSFIIFCSVPKIWIFDQWTAMHGTILWGQPLSLFFLYGWPKLNTLQTQNETEKRLFSKEIKN